MELGAVLFGLLTLVAAYDFVKKLRQSDTFPAWSYVLAMMALVGLMVNLHSEWWLYLVTGATFVANATFAVFGLEQYEMRRTRFVTIAVACVYTAAVLMFVAQPAPALGLLWVLVPSMLCTYVAPLRTQCLKVIDTFTRRASESMQVQAKADTHRQKRGEWLRRR